MKKILFILSVLLAFTVSVNADNDKSYKKDGNTYSSTGRVNINSKPIATGCTWVDSKGNQYPIFMSASGSCYVIKTSKNTGKEYKCYLKPDVSQDICNKLGKEYKPRNKK
jgi:hypothetical protein